MTRLGTEFMPNLNEGTLLYMPTTLPGLSVTKSAELLQMQDRIIRSFPEVESVYGKAGRAQTATDPAPIEMFETVINLKPKEQWRPGLTVDGLIQEMDRSLQFPGVSNAWTMPIKARIDMLSTGIRTPVGVKVIGRDLAEMEKVAREVEKALKTVEGTSSAYAERVVGGYYLEIVPDRDRLARYGLMVSDVQDVVGTALGAEPITTTVEGRERYTVAIRYPRDLRSDPQSIAKDVLVALPTAAARCPWARSPTSGSPRAPPASAPRTPSWRPTSSSTSATATSAATSPPPRRRWPSRCKLPAGTYLVWSGQFEYLQRAEARLQVVVPVTLMIIFLLLYLNFRRLTETLIVMLSLPFALVGGMWLLWWLGFNMSVAVAVGFIALAGVAAETGVVMLIYLDHAAEEIRARCAAARAAVHARRPLPGHHGRRRRARAAEDDDGGRHHGRAAAHHVEHRHRLGGHAAHRRADDRRHGLLDAADPHRHSGDLRPGEGLEFGDQVAGAVTSAGNSGVDFAKGVGVEGAPEAGALAQGRAELEQFPL